MIEFQSVSHIFDHKTVLSSLNLQLTQKRIGIIGHNGSGKSTFARLINGLQIPTQGRVLVDNLDTQKLGKIIRRKVGFVFQNPDHQIILPTVAEDLGFGLKNLKMKPAIIQQKVEEILDEYGLLELKNKQIQHLSGGQKQLIALLGVLIINPNYLVLDEPTTLLDLKHKRKIYDVLENLTQNICVISHDLQFLENFERILVFQNGQLIEDNIPSIAFKKYYDSTIYEI